MTITSLRRRASLRLGVAKDGARRGDGTAEGEGRRRRRRRVYGRDLVFSEATGPF
jgi:hypothetical protein